MERAIRECKQEKEDPEVSCGYHIAGIPVLSLCLSPSILFLYSGSYVMHDMIQHRMPITQQYRVS